MNYHYYKWLYEAMDDKSKNLYVLVGPPGVGKSSWIKKHFSDKQYKVISRDQIIEKIIFKHYGFTAAELYTKERSPEAQKALDELDTIFQSIVMGVLDERPDNVIVDMMNADGKSRSKILDQVKGKYPEYKLIAVKFAFEGHEDKVIASDIKRAEENPARKAINPDYILSIMNRIKADPPTKDEGFDEIQDYNRFKDKEQMKEYNHKQFMDWLNGEIEKEKEVDNKLLTEAKLSKYWKIRAKRRANNAKRSWPNKHDRDWALAEQEKSSNINGKIYALFEKEIEETEDMSEVAKTMMRRMKSNLKKLKLKREAAKLMKPQERLKKKKSLSKPPPKHKKGETVGGYARKASKHYGTPTVAPSEAPIGPMAEEK